MMGFLREKYRLMIDVFEARQVMLLPVRELEKGLTAVWKSAWKSEDG